MPRSHHELLIVGGGNAGISLAARLLRDGAGEATMASLEKPAARVLPDGCTSIRAEVVAVEVDGRAVLTADGRRIGCTTLVVCPGLEEDWRRRPAFGSPPSTAGAARRSSWRPPRR